LIAQVVVNPTIIPSRRHPPWTGFEFTT